MPAKSKTTQSRAAPNTRGKKADAASAQQHAKGDQKSRKSSAKEPRGKAATLTAAPANRKAGKYRFAELSEDSEPNNSEKDSDAGGDDCGSGAEVEDIENDFDGLDNDTIRKTLEEERPTFAKSKVTESRSRSKAVGIDHMEDHPRKHRNHEHHKHSRYAAGSRALSPDHPDSDQSHSDNSPQSDGPVSATAGLKTHSKRDLMRLAEIPQWNTSGSEPFSSPTPSSRAEGDYSSSTASRKRSRQHDDDPNAGWDRKAHYYPPSKGALGIKDQPSNLRMVISSTIQGAERYILFVNSYPSPAKRDHLIGKLFRSAARCHDQPLLAERSGKDPRFAGSIASLVAARMGSLRSNAHALFSGSVAAYYLAADPRHEPTITRIQELVDTGDYIYPPQSADNLEPDNRKPFCHPAIIDCLTQVVFVGSRRVYAEDFASDFPWHQDGDIVRKEIPAAMVGFAATIVLSALDEWLLRAHSLKGPLKAARGARSTPGKKQEFKADHYDDNYRGHLEFLGGIEEADLKRYQRCMARIYDLANPHSDASGHNLTSGGALSGAAKKAMARLNLEGMDDF